MRRHLHGISLTRFLQQSSSISTLAPKRIGVERSLAGIPSRNVKTTILRLCDDGRDRHDGGVVTANGGGKTLMIGECRLHIVERDPSVPRLEQALHARRSFSGIR